MKFLSKKIKTLPKTDMKQVKGGRKRPGRAK